MEIKVFNPGEEITDEELEGAAGGVHCEEKKHIIYFIWTMEDMMNSDWTNEGNITAINKFEEVLRNHGIPENVISNTLPEFTAIANNMRYFGGAYEIVWYEHRNVAEISTMVGMDF